LSLINQKYYRIGMAKYLTRNSDSMFFLKDLMLCIRGGSRNLGDNRNNLKSKPVNVSK
jgi:hypothetical protein